MTEKLKLNVYIRWMIRRDMPEVSAIEKDSFENPWMKDDFIRCLRQRNCIGMVAEFDDQDVGFMLYELKQRQIQLLNFAVACEFRRCGVGAQMVNKMINKLQWQRRHRIVLEIRESNLDGQLFFQKQGFKATSVLRDFYDDTNEDAYFMQYRVSKDDDHGRG